MSSKSSQEIYYAFELLTTCRSQLFRIKHHVERARKELEESADRYEALTTSEDLLRREIERLDEYVNH